MMWYLLTGLLAGLLVGELGLLGWFVSKIKRG